MKHPKPESRRQSRGSRSAPDPFNILPEGGISWPELRRPLEVGERLVQPSHPGKDCTQAVVGIGVPRCTLQRDAVVAGCFREKAASGVHIAELSIGIASVWPEPRRGF
jgi:hypothetical protein